MTPVHGALLALPFGMSDQTKNQTPDRAEEKGAKEDQVQKIEAIVGDEVLGYEGSARGEHSGQASLRDDGEELLEDRLADNRPDQVR